MPRLKAIPADAKLADITKSSSPPSIIAVANRAKVSIATVSRVVNNRGRVQPEMARRVRAAVEEMGYRPDPSARTLSSGRSRLLGVIISNLTNPFFPELLQNFEEHAVALGYEVLVASTAYDLRRMETCIDRMLERKVDGVAIMTFGMEEPLLNRFVDRGIPLIFMDKAPEGKNSFAIEVDYETGIHQAVQHLAILGHRSVGFVSGPDNQISVANRKAAVNRALRAAGLTQGPEFTFSGDHSLESGGRALMAFMSLPKPPTAILCSNDLSAIGVMHEAYNCGISFPRDMSLIGFDGIEIGAYMVPPLTSVVMSRREIAKVAVQALSGWIEGGEVVIPKIGTQLLVRRTTSVPAGSIDYLTGQLNAPRPSTPGANG